MEPLNKHWGSTWYRVYGGVYDSTPRSWVWDSVFSHLLRQFDRLFIGKDK